MFESSKAFSGFAVDDVAKARTFYGGTLGLRVSDELFLQSAIADVGNAFQSGSVIPAPEARSGAGPAGVFPPASVGQPVSCLPCGPTSGRTPPHRSN